MLKETKTSPPDFASLLNKVIEASPQLNPPQESAALPSNEDYAIIDQLAATTSSLSATLDSYYEQVRANILTPHLDGPLTMEAYELYGVICSMIAFNSNEEKDDQRKAIQKLSEFPEVILQTLPEIFTLFDELDSSEWIGPVALLQKVADSIHDQILEAWNGDRYAVKVGIVETLGDQRWPVEFALPMIFEGLTWPQPWAKNLAGGALRDVMRASEVLPLLKYYEEYQARNPEQHERIKNAVASSLVPFDIYSFLTSAHTLGLGPKTINVLEIAIGEKLQRQVEAR